MHITLKQLRAFRAVASLGQVQLAASQLHLSQPATSMAVSELEKQLNCRLFDRTANRLKLNCQGIKLLPLACELLDRSEEVSELFLREDQSLSGQLHIGASATIGNYLLPQILATYEKQHPGVTARLDIHNSSRVIEKLVAFEVDIACIEGRCHHNDIEVIPWLDDELVICASPSHPIAKERVIPLNRLANEYWLLREPGSATRMLFDDSIAQHLQNLTIRMELNQTEAIKHLVISGTGISCLSRFSIAKELKKGELVCVRLKGKPLKRKLSLLKHKKKYEGTLVNSFLDAIRAYTQN